MVRPRNSWHLRALSVIVVAAASGLPLTPIHAQDRAAELRADQPQVLPPRPPLERAPAPNFAAEFAQRYQRAGSPRLMLLWNVELSARTGQEWVLRDNEQLSGSRNLNMLKQTTTGLDGSATMSEGGVQSQSQRQRELTVGQREDAKRATVLSERNAAQLLRAFEARMRDGGARLVDYTLAVRTAAVNKDGPATTGDVNARTLEAAAVRNRAEMLLQILLVPDDHASLGYAFDVSVREVANGMVVTSLYTRAVPPPLPTHTSYAATNKGFEQRTVTLGKIGINDVGAKLADEIMNQLGPVLAAAPKRR